MLGRPREEEREEIEQHIALYGRPADVLPVSYSDAAGRNPLGPARGWRGRQRKAESCELCEGDLWVESADGVKPCHCRAQRKAQQQRRRLKREGWLTGPSLNFSRPPLSYLPSEVEQAIEQFSWKCRDLSREAPPPDLWLVGSQGRGKSSVCGFLAHQLGERVTVRHCGKMLADLRLAAARDGESTAEEEMERLTRVPVLVVDDLDRPLLRRIPSSSLTMRESCSSYDVIRLSRILRDRSAARLPTVVTSSCPPSACADATLSIKPSDLIRALLSLISSGADPIEDFPRYTEAALRGAMAGLVSDARVVDLDQEQRARVAA
jgi:hypothetical protein